MNKKVFYVTTTIPYVNAAPHLGHVLEFVVADVLARYRRLIGDDVYFLSGTDENAIKNVQAAEKEGTKVEDFINRNSHIFHNLLVALNISIDQFIRTTEKRHFLGVQALWQKTAKGDIYKKSYKGLYCVGCEQFYKSEELNERGECYEHPGKKLESVEEENYFFRLSKYQQWILELVESDTLKIVPEFRKREIVSFITHGLEDFSVSRPAERTKNWGVAVPDDPDQTVYVWYDALANYITALGYPGKNADLYQRFWAQNPNKVHVLGKGVGRFHAIYWPAMLHSADLPLPTTEIIHGYLTLNGQKISKTLGNVVDPFELIKKYGADAVRYYLLGIPLGNDGDFSYEKFEEKYNADLANGLGNFAARVLALADRDASLRMHANDTSVDSLVDEKIKQTKELISQKLKEFKFNEALAAIWELIAFGDAYVNDREVWAIKDKDSKTGAILNLVVILDNVAIMIRPFLPETSERITKSISWSDNNVLRVARIKPLFPRL